VVRAEQVSVLRMILRVQPVRISYINGLSIVLARFVGKRGALCAEDDFTRLGGFYGVGGPNRKRALGHDEDFVIGDDPCSCSG
jgi:hypothetical protein